VHVVSAIITAKLCHFRKNVTIRDVIAIIYCEMFSCAVSKSVVVHTSLTNKILLFPLNAIDLLI